MDGLQLPCQVIVAEAVIHAKQASHINAGGPVRYSRQMAPNLFRSEHHDGRQPLASVFKECNLNLACLSTSPTTLQSNCQ